MVSVALQIFAYHFLHEPTTFSSHHSHNFNKWWNLVYLWYCWKNKITNFIKKKLQIGGDN